MPQDFTVSSTGFVNYFPSAERTARNVKLAYEQHGDSIAIIDGDDDWYADPIFHVSRILNDAGIKSLGSFHTGISGISNSGAVIAAKDLPKLITWVEKNNPKYKTHGKAVRSRLAFYDKAEDKWCTLVQKEWDF